MGTSTGIGAMQPFLLTVPLEASLFRSSLPLVALSKTMLALTVPHAAPADAGAGEEVGCGGVVYSPLTGVAALQNVLMLAFEGVVKSNPQNFSLVQASPSPPPAPPPTTIFLCA